MQDPNNPLPLVNPAQQNPGILNSWLANPSNRAAMLQAGLAMMQPVAIGQSTIGHLAGAVGQGAEAKGRAEEQALENQKTQAEADRAAASASRAEQGMEIQRERLELSKSREGRLGKGKGISALFKSPAHRQAAIEKAYGTLAKAESENAVLNGRVTTIGELISNPEWRARNKIAAENLSGASAENPQELAPGASPAPGAQQYPEGHIQKNPKTGQRRQMQGGQWVILPTTGG